MRLGFRLVESLYPPNQPLNGGNPIENLTGNLKRKFQFMIVSFDTIIVNRLRVFSNLKSTRERVSTPTCPDLPRPESGPASGPQPLGKIFRPPLPPLRQHLLLVTLRILDPLRLAGHASTLTTLLPGLTERHHLQPLHQCQPLGSLTLTLQLS